MTGTPPAFLVNDCSDIGKNCQESYQFPITISTRVLEKKKDYIARARDFQEKQATLKLLRKRALNKNPDEFYFHMINSQMVDGVHREKNKEDQHTPQQIKLLETQDVKYAYKRNIEAKKIDKLQSQLHMIDIANETPNQHIFFLFA